MPLLNVINPKLIPPRAYKSGLLSKAVSCGIRARSQRGIDKCSFGNLVIKCLNRLCEVIAAAADQKQLQNALSR
jgi:hypothetical protein